MGAVWIGLAFSGFAGLGCGSSGGYKRAPSVRLKPGPSQNPEPAPTPPPSCVLGALVDETKVCGIGVASPAYHWNDPSMLALVQRRAAGNLAGMMRTVVNSAMILHQDERGYWSRSERYLEIDDALIDRVDRAADHEVWYDVLGTGPLRQRRFTYACACMSTAEAGIRIDGERARRFAYTRQYSAQEVPPWVVDAHLHNEAQHCAVGYHERMFFIDAMVAQLTDSVREQLVGETQTWILDEFSDRLVCATEDVCASDVKSLIEAANEGVSRGVALTALWFDTRGIGPNRKKDSVYGWGCVHDRDVLAAAERRLLELRASRPLVSVHP